MKKFVCSVCGYVHEGDSAPEKCPQCGVPASKFNEQSGEKTWAAEQDYETEATNLQMLQAIAEDLKGKLEQWSKDDVIFTF